MSGDSGKPPPPADGSSSSNAPAAAEVGGGPGGSHDDAHPASQNHPPHATAGPSNAGGGALPRDAAAAAAQTQTRLHPRARTHPPSLQAAPGAAASSSSSSSLYLQQHGFVAPSSYLHHPARPDADDMTAAVPAPKPPETAADRDQQKGLRSIRTFLRVRNSYDVLPMSFRLIMLDTRLLVKSSLNILSQNGIVSAPLWDSKTSTFAGLLTTSDYINVVQYYWQNPDAIKRIDSFRLDSLRDIEKALGVAPIEAISIHPSRPLYEACTRMLETRARRIPLVDIDEDTQRPTVCSVITQYRILKFIAVNVTDTHLLRKPLRHLPAGTSRNLEVCRMTTPVINVINQMVRRNISCVPMVNTDGVVVNVFEAVDVITLIKGNNYDGLTISVGQALQKRPADFPGIYTCSLDDRLDTIFDTLRKSRVHRFIIVDAHSRLVGVLSLSDILEYVLLNSEGDEPRR